MTNKTVTLDLSSGGGRQTLPEWDNTNVEITTSWSNGKTASDNSVCNAPVEISLTNYTTTWYIEDDWTGAFETNSSILSQPDVYIGGVLQHNIIDSWTEYISGHWEIVLQANNVSPALVPQQIITIEFRFSTGNVLQATGVEVSE